MQCRERGGCGSARRSPSFSQRKKLYEEIANMMLQQQQQKPQAQSSGNNQKRQCVAQARRAIFEEQRRQKRQQDAEQEQARLQQQHAQAQQFQLHVQLQTQRQALSSELSALTQSRAPLQSESAALKGQILQQQQLLRALWNNACASRGEMGAESDPMLLQGRQLLQQIHARDAEVEGMLSQMEERGAALRRMLDQVQEQCRQLEQLIEESARLERERMESEARSRASIALEMEPTPVPPGRGETPQPQPQLQLRQGEQQQRNQLAQDNPKKKGGCGSISGSWQDLMSERDDVMDTRRRIREKLERYLEHLMRADPSAPNKALIVLASKLENKLFLSSPSFEAYSNPTTLETRLKILAMQIGKRVEAHQVSTAGKKRTRMGSVEGAQEQSKDGAAEPTTTDSSLLSSSEEESIADGTPNKRRRLRCRRKNGAYYASERRRLLRSRIGDDLYTEMLSLVAEVRSIRRTSDVWMCSQAANRNTSECGGGRAGHAGGAQEGEGGGGAVCRLNKRRSFTRESLEAAASIATEGASAAETRLQRPPSSRPTPPPADAPSQHAHHETVLAAESTSNTEQTAAQAMPSALTAIYFRTRLVEAETALGTSSVPYLDAEKRVSGVDWEELIGEAKRNVRAFRVLEEDTAAADKEGGGEGAAERFVEVCTIAGGCRRVPLSLGDFQP